MHTYMALTYIILKTIKHGHVGHENTLGWGGAGMHGTMRYNGLCTMYVGPVACMRFPIVPIVVPQHGTTMGALEILLQATCSTIYPTHRKYIY